jgi:hypothetical protein
MREPMSRDSAAPRELAEATRRLDAALERLEAACAEKIGATAQTASFGALDEAAYAALESDRARLAADLDAALAREGELESAAAAASQALGRAAAEVRAALGDSDQGDSDQGDGEAKAKPVGDGMNEEAA